MLVCSLPVKSRKRLPQDIFDALATNVSLVYDFIDTDYRTQNGMYFGNFQIQTFNMQGQKTCAQLLCLFSILIQVIWPWIFLHPGPLSVSGMVITFSKLCTF